MNYYQARQVDPKADRPDAGKWRWTRMNDGRVWPTANCASCAGHDTSEEAEHHFWEWERDNLHEFKHDAMQVKCAVCGVWTDTALVVAGGGGTTDLCSAHLNKEGWASANPFEVGISVTSSY